MYNFVWNPSDNIVQGFYLCNIAPGGWDNFAQDFFLCSVVWSLFSNIEQSFASALLFQEY